MLKHEKPNSKLQTYWCHSNTRNVKTQATGGGGGGNISEGGENRGCRWWGYQCERQHRQKITEGRVSSQLQEDHQHLAKEESGSMKSSVEYISILSDLLDQKNALKCLSFCPQITFQTLI